MANENNKIPGHFPSADETERNFYISLIEPVTNRWMQNEVSQAHMVITLISGANAGGAVAILTYIAQGPAAQGIASPALILLGYLCGFAASLLCAVGVYYASRRRLNIWTDRVSAFYAGDCLWRGVWAKHGHPWYGGPVLDGLAWLSFILFLSTSATGVAQMLCTTPKPFMDISGPDHKEQRTPQISLKAHAQASPDNQLPWEGTAPANANATNRPLSNTPGGHVR